MDLLHSQLVLLKERSEDQLVGMYTRLGYSKS